MTLGRRVLQLREQADLTQEELAAKVGVDRSYIAHIEHGRTKQPGADVLTALARALGATPEDLYAAIIGEDSEPPLPRDAYPADLRGLFDQIAAVRERHGAREARRLERRIRALIAADEAERDEDTGSDESTG